MRYDVVLVTGTGRSGTTAVSRCLHEMLGVKMCHPEALDKWPGPFYECPEFQRIAKSVTKDQRPASDFAPRFMSYFQERLDFAKGLFGFKSPQMCYLMEPIVWTILALVPKAQVLVLECQRSLFDCAESAQRNGHMREFVRAMETLHLRELILERQLAGLRPKVWHHRLDMCVWRSEGELVEMLQGILNSWEYSDG